MRNRLFWKRQGFWGNQKTANRGAIYEKYIIPALAVLPAIFGGVSDPVTTVIIYLLYIFVPAMFYLPGFIAQRRNLVKTK